MRISRRSVIKGAAAGIALAGCGGDGGDGDGGDDGGDDVGDPPDAAIPITPPETVAEVPQFGLGISSGDLVGDRGVVWTRYDGMAALAAVVYRMDGDDYVEELGPYPATPADGGFVHVAIDGLVPGARYRYAFFELDGDTRTGRSTIGRFRTPIASDAMEPLVFGAVSCCNRSEPFTVLARAAERTDLDGFIFCGDNAYTDEAGDDHAERRELYVQHFGKPEHLAVRASTAIAGITWDDHEVDNDYNPETIDPAVLDSAFRGFFEHAPIAKIPGDERRLWRSIRWGLTAEIFVLDCRSERRRSMDLYLSPEQMQWLEDGLAASPAVFKIIVNSVPITNMPSVWDVYPTDRWEGYPDARAEILTYIDSAPISGVIWLAGDFHLAFISHVSTSGAGANQREVLCGPGAQGGNVLTWSLQPPQFSFKTAINNYTTLALDPANRQVTVAYHDADGVAFHSESFVP